MKWIASSINIDIYYTIFDLVKLWFTKQNMIHFAYRDLHDKFIKKWIQGMWQIKGSDIVNYINNLQS